MNIRDYLAGRRVSFDMLLHPPAATATHLARSIHVPGHKVAKGVLVRVGEGYALAILSATSRIDLDQLSRLVGDRPVRIASESETQAVFSDCERGAIPPFGRAYGLSSYIDALLSAGSELVCVGNQRHEGIRISMGDFLRLEEPVQGRFTTPSQEPLPRAPRRRAG